MKRLRRIITLISLPSIIFSFVSFSILNNLNSQNKYELKTKSIITNAPTQFVEKNIIEDKRLIETYARNFDRPNIIEYILTNQSSFILNVPNLTWDDIVIWSYQQIDDMGYVVFTFGLRRYYDNSGNIVINNGDVFKKEFTLRGFKTDDVKLKKDGIFAVDELGLNNPILKLNSPILNDELFKSIIVTFKDVIFVGKYDYLKASNIDIKSSKKYYEFGIIDMNFSIKTRVWETSPVNIIIYGFEKMQTIINSNEYQYGDFRITASQVSKEWIKQKVIEKQSIIFNDLPIDFNFDKDLLISDIKPDNKTGRVNFKVTINNVYAENGTLSGFLTFSNFKNDNFVSTFLKIKSLNYDDKIFPKIFIDDRGFYVDWLSYSTFNKAFDFKNYINDNIDYFLINYAFNGNVVLVKNVTFSNFSEKTQTVQANIVFDKWFINDQWSFNDHTEEITIKLRKIPTSNYYIKLINDYLMNIYSHNINDFPKTDNDIHSIILDVFNKNINDIPLLVTRNKKVILNNELIVLCEFKEPYKIFFQEIRIGLNDETAIVIKDFIFDKNHQNLDDDHALSEKYKLQLWATIITFLSALGLLLICFLSFWLIKKKNSKKRQNI